MIKKSFIVLLSIFLFIFPSLALSFVRENWPTYMGNQYLTGNNDGIIPESSGIIWTFGSKGKLFNPVSVNGRVFVVSTDHYLYCLDAADGSLLWKYKAEGPLTRMVAVYQGYVYLPAGRFLYCIDEENGEVIWGRRDPSFGFYGTPTVSAGKIFYGNRKGFYARELRNGHLMWENKDIYTYGGFPSYWNGMVYTVSKEFQRESAFLVALNENDGTVRWATPLENVVNIFSPVIWDEKIYLTWGKTLGVFDAETGEKVLEKTFDAAVASNAVFSQGTIFMSLANGRILKIDPDTGEYRVIYDAPFGTQFAVVGSYLFIPIKGGRGALVTIDSESGNTVTRIPTIEGEPSTLTISKGVIFLPTENTLMAIGDGRLVRAYRPPRPEKPEVEIPEKPAPRIPERGTGVSVAAPGAAGEEAEIPGAGAGTAGVEPGTEGIEGPEGSAGAPGGQAEAEEGKVSEEGKIAKAVPPEEAPSPGTEIAPGEAEAPGGVLAEKPEVPSETAVIKGELKDKDSGKPLSGTVEATTELESGDIVKKEEPIREGQFEIEVPKKGQTDLIFSSPGYTFETITLPDEKAIDDLSLQPIELGLSRVKKGEKLKFESIQYKFESANLEPSSLGTLNKMLTMLKDNPSIKIEIAGHTDSTGPEEVNQRLSELRAESVANWLIMNGVSSKRIITKGYGETKPVADNSTEEGRRKNRRTEVLIIDD
ncbi:MAG: hypothetical protein AMS17_16185 [Spirochaetes bacterium DG_61]|nr:MAG: hypothetical protein AMS17_16185 [Spirochaetes bacterium DG_61]